MPAGEGEVGARAGHRIQEVADALARSEPGGEDRLGDWNREREHQCGDRDPQAQVALGGARERERRQARDRRRHRCQPRRSERLEDRERQQRTERRPGEIGGIQATRGPGLRLQGDRHRKSGAGERQRQRHRLQGEDPRLAGIRAERQRIERHVRADREPEPDTGAEDQRADRRRPGLAAAHAVGEQGRRHPARSDAEERERDHEEGVVVPDGEREDAGDRHLEDEHRHRDQEHPAEERWMDARGSHAGAPRRWRAIPIPRPVIVTQPRTLSAIPTSQGRGR